MLKPKHSFRSVVTELVKGLQSGELSLRGEPEAAPPFVVRRVRFHASSQIYVSALPVSYGSIRWSGRAASSSAY